MQLFNEERLKKKSAMRYHGINGKQFRKWQKLSRRDPRLAQDYLDRIKNKRGLAG